MCARFWEIIFAVSSASSSGGMGGMSGHAPLGALEPSGDLGAASSLPSAAPLALEVPGDSEPGRVPSVGLAGWGWGGWRRAERGLHRGRQAESQRRLAGFD